jgi:alpha-tubulin suppressor-like RCC1 family protein
MKKLLLKSLLLASLITNAQCWESVSNGETHVMGIKPNGTLWGWGRENLNGNGGNFTSQPQQIGTATDWKSVHAGIDHSLGIKDSGILWGWGSNLDGNLGIGSAIQSSLVPVQVGTATWKTVSSGGRHSLGIRTNGTLWGWGWNENATVGDGTTINRTAHVLINSSTNWKMVSCNLFRSMAVKEDGTLWGWGSNSVPLGITSETGGQALILIPTQIGTDTDWKTIVVTFGHFLGLKNNNTLWAWGGGDKGQLGNGSTNASFLPTQVGTDTDWAFIEGDAKSSFAIKTNGTLWAWGENLWGQMGNGNQTDLLIPTQIGTATDWSMVSTSYFATVSLKTDGSLFTWGSSSFGQLGTGIGGPPTIQLTPLLINACNLGTEDFNKKKVNLYPNPVQNRLFIDSEETQQYQIYSILGSKISEGTLVVGSGIDCSGLTSGVYLLSLMDDYGATKTVKFVKQ